MWMTLCNYLLEKRDRCHALHIFTIFASPAFSTSSEVRVLDRRVLPRDYPNLRTRQTKVDTLTICFRVAGHLQTWPQRQQGPIYGCEPPLPPPPPAPDCIIAYWFENGHIFHVLSSSSFYLSFLFIKRSKGVMIAQQSFGGNCQPVQNWLQGQMKQNRANRWHSLENLSKF